MTRDLESAPTQRKALEAILAAAEPGEPVPTLQELAETLELKAQSNVRRVLEELERKGYIVWERGLSGRARTGRIRPTKKAYDWQEGSRETSVVPLRRAREAKPGVRLVPVSGEAAAGTPIPADEESLRPISDDEESARDYLPLPARHLHPAEDEAFLVQVRGESMKGDGVLPSDYVVVVPDLRWRNGEMVVVLLDGEVTVKRVWREGTGIRLVSSNPDFPARTLKRADELQIRGKVIGLVRWDIK
jgi:repressor LexA